MRGVGVAVSVIVKGSSVDWEVRISRISSQDGACSVCFLLQHDCKHFTDKEIEVTQFIIYH